MRFCRVQKNFKINVFKINFFEKFLQEYHLSVKQIGSRSQQTFCYQLMTLGGKELRDIFYFTINLVIYQLPREIYQNPSCLQLQSFSSLFAPLGIFFQNQLFQKFFQEYHLSVKQIGSWSGPRFCLIWGLIWGQTVSKVYQQTTLGRQWVKHFYHMMLRLGVK